MKNYIFTLGVFGVGVAAGVAVAALIFKKRYAKKLQKEIDGIVETNKAVNARRKNRPDTEEPQFPNDIRETERENDIDSDATGTSDAPEDREEELYEDLVDGYSAKGFQPALSFVHNISQEEFEEINGYSKRHVCFYESDEVAICNETGIELDLDEDLGNDYGCLDEDNAADDGVIYIRNPKYATDYAVDIYPGGVAGLQD